MPLEIRELGIHVRVPGDECDSPPGELKDGPAGSVDHDKIVAECVRRVLLTLKSLRER